MLLPVLPLLLLLLLLFLVPMKPRESIPNKGHDDTRSRIS